MGVWGEFDDENDTVADIFAELEEQYLCQNHPDILYLKSNNQYDEYYKQKTPVLFNAKVKLSEITVPFLKKSYSKRPGIIAGITLRIARLGNENMYPHIFEDNNIKNLKLFSGFSPELKIMALDASKTQLNKLSLEEGWSDIETRRKALQEQIKLFS